MSSLRARVLVSVVALAAVGLIALGAVTYAEQRSFLLGRVDQQARAAVNPLSQLLDNEGFRPPAEPGPGAGQAYDGAGGPHGGAGGHPNGGGPHVNLPPGTWGERRSDTGQIIGHPVLIKYSAAEPATAAPLIPASMTPGQLITVGSSGSSGLHYRLLAKHDPEDSGTTIIAVPLGDVESTLHRLLLVEALVIGGVLVALGLTAFFVVKLGLRPLTRFEVTAGQIAAGDLSRRVSPATPKTEIGRLGLALNRMLERLEQAFAAREESEQRLRRFLADASHELRTPLASIRGYAELYRMGATRDEAGTETAMRRIEQESARMGVLVEDLLTLARLDAEPEREHAPVDLAALAHDAVHDARARAPERAVELRAPERAIVSGDAPQLRQLFTNLLGNAISHTPAGTPIEVALERRDGTVELSVRDHGPGIPPEAREHLFDRFWRRERGRERGRAGAGLGLAIVNGVVEAHHGRIAVRDPQGGGAEFLVTLPAADEAQPPPASR